MEVVDKNYYPYEPQITYFIILNFILPMKIKRYYNENFYFDVIF